MIFASGAARRDGSTGGRVAVGAGPATGGCCWRTSDQTVKPRARATTVTAATSTESTRARRLDRRSASSSTTSSEPAVVSRATTDGAAAGAGSGSSSTIARRGRASSGGSWRTPLMPARTPSRRAGGGGGAEASSDSSAAVSQNSRTSWRQVGHTARCASNSSSSSGSSASTTYEPVAPWISLMLSTPSRLDSERVSQPDQAVSYPCLNRAERQLEQRGDLALRVPAEVGERQSLSLDGSQRLHPSTDALGVQLLLHAFPDVVDLAGRLGDRVVLVPGHLAGD